MIRLAELALQTEDEAAAVPIVSAAARRAGTNPRLWQWTGLLHRALDDRVAALQAFTKAATLAPYDPSIAHGLARTQLEAGLSAVGAFETAHRIAPLDGDVLLGLAAARLADGDASRACAGLDVFIRKHPGWIAGHYSLARLCWMTGDDLGFVRSLESALSKSPRDPALWKALIDLLIKAGQYERALSTIAQARYAMGDAVFLIANEALALSEIGRCAAADTSFALLADTDDVNIVVHQVRHLLRTGRVEPARDIIERWTASPDFAPLWPYASLAWRLCDDPRWGWLQGAETLVSVVDISAQLPSLERLATILRQMHTARGEQLDQSVRGGTQTDGILLARTDPEIISLRTAIVAATRAHIARLPARDARHPTLRARRDRAPRFSGSWSVRLTGAGRHANHVHPAGWLSSALYIGVPPTHDDDPHAGWLTLGTPQAELSLDLPATRCIEPKPGRLVIFPSTMWHGTLPVASGERLTVAFDVKEPV
ncbi:2OG-Fe(II) oxygenase family protein [Sphingomonas sp. NFX23]|uniref:2OG-Fe(II) oxygenase family protein n=1 Tax=Sphingomonas sp. NFX23 TaxID=2819532 RepID=UPI003CF3F8B3